MLSFNEENTTHVAWYVKRIVPFRNRGLFAWRHDIDAGSKGLDLARGLGERLLVFVGPSLNRRHELLQHLNSWGRL